MSDAEKKNGVVIEETQNDKKEILSNGRETNAVNEADVLEDGTKGLPIDRGWAWVVLTGNYSQPLSIRNR